MEKQLRAKERSQRVVLTSRKIGEKVNFNASKDLEEKLKSQGKVEKTDDMNIILY